MSGSPESQRMRGREVRAVPAGSPAPQTWMWREEAWTPPIPGRHSAPDLLDVEVLDEMELLSVF